MEKEVWETPKIEFLKRYEVSTFGNMRIANSGVQISLRKGKRGYVSKNFRINKVVKTFTVHRIVAITFIKNPLNKAFVNHINGIKTDNRVSNLEWVTCSENELHAHRTGLKTATWQNKFGKNHHRSIPCIQISLDGFIIDHFDGQHEAARETGIDVRAINACIKGKIKTTNNYIFL